MMCEFCAYVESAGSTIPATGEHGDTYLSGERNGTCTRKGYSGNIKCCDCDKIIEKGKPTDYYHPNYKYTISPLPATCTSEGHTYESDCLDCGKVLNESRVLPKTKHRWERFLEVPATCTTKGMKAHFQCTVCNRYSEDNENWFVSNRSLIIPSLGGHKWADATCAAPKTCTVCKETEGEKLDTHTANIVKSDNDYHWSECACGETAMGKTVHTYDQTVADDAYKVSAADCDSKAVYHKSCKCGAAGTDTFTRGEPLGHKEVTVTGKAASCTATGLTDGKKCSVCGEVIEEQITIPMKDHTWNTGKITKAATCAEEGVKTYTCTVSGCGKTKTESIAKLTTHNYHEATCTKAKTCKVCGVTSGEALGHDYSDTSTVDTKATMDKAGSKSRHCSRCDAKASKTAIAKISSVKLFASAFTYNGKLRKPEVTVKNSKGNKIAAKYYSVSYKNNKNAGTATATVTFKTNYSGSKKLTFKIKPKKITKATLGTTTYVYDGKAKKPAVTVKSGTTTLLNKKTKGNRSVSVTYAKGRIKVGTYEVTIKGKGNYTGTITKTFTMNPKTASILAPKAGKKQITVKWKKVSKEATGYEVMYSTSKTFKKGTATKTKTVKSYNKTSLKITKLKAKKTYYVKVRTYKTVGGKKFYSGWSAAKKVKTK